MNDIIGKHGGGHHGGGHHGGGHHHGGHGHRGGRRYFGGGWGSYDYAPWYDYDDEMIELVPVQIINRPPANALVLSGAHGELADLGAVLAPGARGLSVKFDVGGDQILHAAICIDGHCYEGCANLAPMLAQPMQNPEEAVQIAGDILVGALIDDHTTTLSAGWWSAVKKATYGVHHGVAKVVQKFKVPITIAATAVATVYGGPAGGAAAAKFTGPLVDGMADDFKSLRGGNAKKTIADAEKAAKDDPAIAKALDDAKKAVAQTAAGYALKDTAEKAAAGDPEAIKKMKELDAAASAGDPGAQKAAEAIAVTAATKDENKKDEGGGFMDVLKDLGMAALQSKLKKDDAKPDQAKADAAMAENSFRGETKVSGIHAVSTELLAAARRMGSRVARESYAKHPANALGFVYLMTGQWSALPFDSLDDADDWWGSLSPDTYLYAAYYDPHGAMWPRAENENTWKSGQRRTNVSGLPVLPFLLGAGAGAAGMYGYQRYRETHAAAAAMPPVASNAPGSAPSTAVTPAMASGVATLAPNDPIFVDITCIDEDGNETDDVVRWPTSQNAKHFGRAPDFYFEHYADGNAYVWVPRDWDGEDKGQIRRWRPTWHPIKHPRRRAPVSSGAGVPSWIDAGEASLMRSWYAFAKRYRHPRVPFVIMERGSQGPGLRWLDAKSTMQDAMLTAARVAGDYPAESTVYVFDARQPNGRPLSGVPGYSYALQQNVG